MIPQMLYSEKRTFPKCSIYKKRTFLKCSINSKNKVVLMVSYEKHNKIKMFRIVVLVFGEIRVV